jgi:hypothetical protein
MLSKAAIKVVALTVALMALFSVVSVATAPTAQAAEVYCSGGVRCTVYTTRAETLAIARGNFSAVAARVPHPVLKGAVLVLLHSHRWFAQQYYNMGRCVRIDASLVPWEGRGMSSYRC